MKLVAINGRAWSKTFCRTHCARRRKVSIPIDLLIENAKFFKTYSIDYHGGIRNPHSRARQRERSAGEILNPLTK